MYSLISTQEKTLYKTCGLIISEYVEADESQDYNACCFKLNNQTVFYRKAKITPKKIGQFVTFWKRQSNQSIAPFNASDALDFYVINVVSGKQVGQFVFPKSVLISKGILSTSSKEGKRGFRVYPVWDKPISKQAIRTQKWQLDYFLKLDDSVVVEKVNSLYL